MYKTTDEYVVCVGWIKKYIQPYGKYSQYGAIGFFRPEMSEFDTLFFHKKDISQNSELLEYFEKQINPHCVLIFKYIGGFKNKAFDISFLTEIPPDVAKKTIDKSQYEPNDIRILLEEYYSGKYD